MKQCNKRGADEDVESDGDDGDKEVETPATMMVTLITSMTQQQLVVIAAESGGEGLGLHGT